MEQARDKLANAEVALKETQRKTGIIQLDSQTRAIIDSVVRLRAQISSKEVELQSIGSFATAQNPRMVTLQREISSMKDHLASLEKQSGSWDGDIQLPTGNVPEASLEYIRKVRDLKYYETVFDMLARQFEAANLDEVKNAVAIQVVDPGIEPDKKSSPERSLIVVIAALFAFFASAFYALSREEVQKMRDKPHVNARLTAFGRALSFAKR